MTPAQRAAVVAEARSWLLTPYVHCGDIKGVGVDCAMLLVRVFCDTGVVPAFDPRPYSPTWYIFRDEHLYMEAIIGRADKVDHAQPGDVALFKFGRSPSHAGIVVADGVMIHAYQATGNVELCDICTLADRFVGFWSPR